MTKGSLIGDVSSVFLSLEQEEISIAASINKEYCLKAMIMGANLVYSWGNWEFGIGNLEFEFRVRVMHGSGGACLGRLLVFR